MEITATTTQTCPFEDQTPTCDYDGGGTAPRPYPGEEEDENEDEPGKEKKKVGNKKSEEGDEEGEGKKKSQQEETCEKINLKRSSAEMKLETLIKAGLRNIWMVGPAGCGKTTITRNTAKKMDIPCYVVSCGLGTSAAEFNGYKYPSREKTPFAEYYSQPSIILLDEFSALDPSVAQVANSALANGILNTTTGVIERHPECIIVATSNTFGTGADRQYVANNQLDSSTIDRFVGGIMEVNYSYSYESQFDPEVVNYTATLRMAIEKHALRRVASTRMIIEGDKLKKFGVGDWQEHLIVNWSKAEKKLLTEFISELEEMDKAIKRQVAEKENAKAKEKAKGVQLNKTHTRLIEERVNSKESYVKIVSRESNKNEYPYIIKSRSSDFKLYCVSREYALKVLQVIREKILSSEIKTTDTDTKPSSAGTYQEITFDKPFGLWTASSN